MHFEELTIKDLSDLQADVRYQAVMGVLAERLEGIRNELESGVRVIGEKKVEIDYGGLRLRQGECSSLRYLQNLLPHQVAVLEQDMKEKKKD